MSLYPAQAILDSWRNLKINQQFEVAGPALLTYDYILKIFEILVISIITVTVVPAGAVNIFGL